LSSSYRKLGDLWKIARNYAAARQDYSQAIDIGAKLLAAEPDNFEFKTHLATALDDLAQVSQSQGRLDEARQRFGKAEQLFGELVEADPEHLESRLSLLHTQWNRAALERDQAHFAEAARRFRGVRDQAARLRREGRLEGRSAHFVDDHALAIEIQTCEAVRAPSPRTAPEKPERDRWPDPLIRPSGTFSPGGEGDGDPSAAAVMRGEGETGRPRPNGERDGVRRLL
jgi:tetratricopeptide (TPR) repeat protein